MKHAAAFLLFFVALWWLWQLLTGEWSRYEWIAGACAAAIGATLGELARTRARVRAPLTVGMVGSIPSALGMVFVDFAIVLRALATRRKGAFYTDETELARAEPLRAWGAYIATFSPNAYVVDVDPESKTALTHHLVHYKRSQEPV